MADTIEILFEGVSLEKLSEYLSEAIKDLNLVNYQISADNLQPIQKVDKLKSLVTALDRHSEGSIYLNLKDFRLGVSVLPKVGIQILSYSSRLDLSIDIDSDTFQTLGSLSIVQLWAKNVSDKLLAKNYYCGYEPASDEDTRFFAMDKLGPLSLAKDA